MVRKPRIALICLAMVLSVGVPGSVFGSKAIENITIYREIGKFCGWPANEGAWSWGDEILVCFELHKYKDTDRTADPTDHHVDWKAGYEKVTARSLDGGLTWKLERRR